MKPAGLVNRAPLTEYLERLDRELRLRRAPRRRLLAEAEDHLLQSAQELADAEQVEPVQLAVERFGAPCEVARRFAHSVASTSARRAFLWSGIAFAFYAAATVAFGLGAGAEFADFPQGAPTALAAQVATAALALGLLRILRWRSEPVLPHDRLRLVGNAAAIGSGALLVGLALELLVASTRPAGVLPWGDEPLILGLAAAAALAGAGAVAAAMAVALRTETLESGPGRNDERVETLVADLVALSPRLRSVAEAVFGRPRRLVAGTAVLAFGAVVASQWIGTDFAHHASIALPTLALGLLEALALVTGYAVFGRALGLRPHVAPV